jgi:hypothetical protein
MSFRTPLEIGFGKYMGDFYAQLVADTPAMTEYVSRGLAKSIAWVPGRMVDDVKAMLDEWRKNDNERTNGKPGGAPGLTSFLPVMLVGMAKDFNPAPPDWGLPVGSAMDVMNPDDPEQRMFKVRTSMNDYRAQVVIIAPEGHTAHSLAMQFNLWANGPGGRRFKHWHEHAGQLHDFPAVLEQIDLGAIDAKAEQTNLTILIVDLTIRATIPLFQAPKADEPNDGKAAPAGYPVVIEVNGLNTNGSIWKV